MVNLVVQIDGRKAIPVRALPWMTGWHFGAHEVAEALSGDGCESGEPFTTAYWLEADGSKHVTPKHFWVGVTQRLEQAEDAEPPDLDWHAIATGLLPEGVWVWADEWAAAYDDGPDGPGQLERIAVTEEDLKDVESRRIQQNPFVPRELQAILLAGFNEPAGVPKHGAESAPQAVAVAQAEEAELFKLSDLSAVPIEVHKERARLLAMFEKKGGARTRGALAELSRELNVDRSNLKKKLTMAEKERDEKRREGTFRVAANQLVRNGKRHT